MAGKYGQGWFYCPRCWDVSEGGRQIGKWWPANQITGKPPRCPRCGGRLRTRSRNKALDSYDFDGEIEKRVLTLKK